MRNISMYMTFLVVLTVGCSKFIEPEPPKTQLVGETVFMNESTAKAALTAAYLNLYNTASMGASSIQGAIPLTGLSSDELTNFSSNGDYMEFASNELSSNNPCLKTLWGNAYFGIYQVNTVIERVSTSNTLSDALKQQLTGEAKFIRAFYNFYLTNLFGEIPIVTTTNYKINNNASRQQIPKVYEQIIADLKEAKLLLLEDYSASGGERIRPNKSTAAAMLAKVYLYSDQWESAEAAASLLIDNKALYDTVSLNNVFLKNSKEAIWQLMPSKTWVNTDEGSFFILATTPRNVSLSNSLIQAFEANDKRKELWTGSLTNTSGKFYFPFKYKVRTGGTGSTPVVPLMEYSMILRIGEQYLIRAEARANQNRLLGSNSAESDLNVIRKRARLPNIAALDKTSMLRAIERERQIELFAEWGWHRWFDLKRTGRANTVLGPIKGSSWQESDRLYPIPQSEILNNPNLGPQNNGY